MLTSFVGPFELIVGQSLRVPLVVQIKVQRKRGGGERRKEGEERGGGEGGGGEERYQGK